MICALQAEELVPEVDSLAQKAIRRGFSRSVFYPLFNRFRVIEKVEEDTLTLVLPEITLNYFRQYEGYQINNIHIQVMKPFGSYYDNSRDFFSFLEDKANKLHIDTRDFVIMNNLLFSKGDRIDPFIFAESERYLRQNSFIFDSGIVVEPVAGKKEADIYVYIQDVWNMRVTGNYDTTKEKGRLELKDINFLGSGGTLKVNLKKNPRYVNEYKPDVQYDYYRLFDKYGVGSFYYLSETGVIHYGFGGNQNFVQPWVCFLGGANFDWWRTRQSVIQNDTLSESQNINYSEQDIWVGYNSVLENQKLLVGKYKHFILAGRMIQRNYHSLPDTHRIYYQDNFFFLGGLTLIKRVFYQDSYIFSFGKTEDIPVGRKFDLIAGRQYGNVDDKSYYGISSTFSFYLDDLGYFFNNTRYGTYINSKDFDNGLFDSDLLYFTNLHYFHPFRYRTYLSMRYSKSINPISRGDLIDINNEDGLRGFDTGYLFGDKRFVVNFENDVFMPYTLMGFNTAFISFLDFSYLAKQGDHLFSNDPHYAFGFGLRLKNEHLVFSTIQLTFGIYPDGDQYGLKNYRFYNQFQPYYQFNRMNYSKPGVFTWD